MTDLPTDAPADVEHEPIDLTAELVAVPTTDVTAADADPAADPAGSSSALPVLAGSRAVEVVAVPDRHPVAVDGELYAVAASRPAWKSMAGPLIGVALVSLGLGFLMARGAGDGGLDVSARTITTPPRPTTTVKAKAVASSLAGGTSTQSGATASAGGATGAGTSASDGASSSSDAANVAGATATNTSSAGSSGTTGSSASSSATSSAASSSSSSSSSTTASAGTTSATTQAAATTAPTTAATTVPTTPAPTDATTVPTTPAPTTAAPTTTLSPGARYRAAVLAAAPQGYWSLDETNSGQAADASGKGRTGSFSGGVSGGQAGAGAGTAVSFNGTDGAMTVADATALRLNGAFSIEMWVKLDAFTHTWPGLLAKGSASTANGYLIYFKPDGRMVFKRNNVEAATSTGALTSGFNHFVVTYDGGTVRWYVNGALQTTKAVTFPTNNGTDAFVVGRGDEYGTMTVDELAVYPSALDGGTIQAHYNALR